MDPDAFYIDEHRRIVRGASAQEDLRAHNDSARVDPLRGIVRVDRERWEEAQRYERRTWLHDGRLASDDRNFDHWTRFDGYGALAGGRFGRVLEIGSGPFTNLRLILSVCQADEVVLLDPLIRAYPRHPFCTYRFGRLEGLLNPLLALRDLRHPRTFWTSRRRAWRVGRWLGKPVRRVAAALEDARLEGPFDLVVMINVLEHCRDAESVLDRLARLTAIGGHVVFADTLYQANDVAAWARRAYDAGHPLRVDQSVVRGFLDRTFSPVWQSERGARQTFAGVSQNVAELYYIGQRKPDEAVPADTDKQTATSPVT